MPALLGDIVAQTLAGANDVTVVGTLESGSSLRAAVDRYEPDVVMVGVEQQDWAGGFVDLFRDHPHLRLLVIRNDGRSAALHELRIRRCRVPDVSPVAILAVLRGSCDELNTHADNAAAQASGRGP